MASSFFSALQLKILLILGNSFGGCGNQKLNLINNGFHYSPVAGFLHLNSKAAKSGRNIKPNSVICDDCDGIDSGVDAVDFFNGQFIAGASCWLCGGNKGNAVWEL
ncbi:Protein BUNDLE SHEATH DEFECTIVE 2, chloroplastic, partial [Cucurbita argyrosperma subsp. sororia]